MPSGRLVNLFVTPQAAGGAGEDCAFSVIGQIVCLGRVKSQNDG